MKSSCGKTIICHILCTGIAGEEGEGCARAVIHFNKVFIMKKPAGSVTAATVSIAFLGSHIFPTFMMLLSLIKIQILLFMLPLTVTLLSC